MYTEISKCRIGKSPHLITVLSLGEQYLTGVFPKSTSEMVTKGPLDVVWCPDSGLLQMKQSYSLEEMYGANYGYRSGLNASMVQHLEQKIRTLEQLAGLVESDLVIDIGSNDAHRGAVFIADRAVQRVGSRGRDGVGHCTRGLS